jgi:hypothetical protein
MSDALRAGLSLTPDELELVQHQMKTGELPRDTLARHADAAAYFWLRPQNRPRRKTYRAGGFCSLAATASTRTKNIAVTNPTFFGERQLVLLDRP